MVGQYTARPVWISKKMWGGKERQEGGVRARQGGRNGVRGENEMGSERWEKEIRRATRGKNSEIGKEKGKYGREKKKSEQRVEG